MCTNWVSQAAGLKRNKLSRTVAQPILPVAQSILPVAQPILPFAQPILCQVKIKLTQSSWAEIGTELGNCEIYYSCDITHTIQVLIEYKNWFYNVNARGYLSSLDLNFSCTVSNNFYIVSLLTVYQIKQ